jgi:hypothetical protein
MKPKRGGFGRGNDRRIEGKDAEKLAQASVIWQNVTVSMSWLAEPHFRKRRQCQPAAKRRWKNRKRNEELPARLRQWLNLSEYVA